MSWVLIHGSNRQTLAPHDRAALYGDALFETLLWSGSQLVLDSFHWQRLLAGVDRLNISLSPERLQAFVADIESKLRAEASGTPCAIRVSVHRSVLERGYSFDRQTDPELVCLINRAPVVTADSVALGISDIYLSRQPLLAGVKHANRLEQVLAAQNLVAQGYDDGLMCLDDGHVICTTRANVYALVGDVWHTPQLDEAGVLGTRRAWFLKLGVQGVWNVQESALTIEQLYQADAVMISNALRGFQAVEAINGTVMRTSPRIDQVRRYYAQVLAGTSYGA